MSGRRRLLVLATAGACVLAACATTTSGSGTAPTSSVSAPSPATSSAPTQFPSASASPSPLGACAESADYCDGFAHKSSGWQIDNQPHYYSSYSAYLGGTYRMGEWTPNARLELAPFDTTTISRGYGVQIDVDAVLGSTAPKTSYAGIVCWDHATAKQAEAGFLFFVTNTSADVTLLADDGGEPHTIAQQGGAGLLPAAPRPFHLSATCEQARSAGATEARLTLAIDGTKLLDATYPRSVKSYPWTPGSKAGLLVAGRGADVFYDNFTVNGR